MMRKSTRLQIPLTIKSINYLLLALVMISCKPQQSLEVDYLTPIKGRWSTEKINTWYAEQPWLVGCNYYPATAINQIDMWQASTWDPERIDLELSWAAAIGMNTLRVYLHDLVWADDEQGLYQRMDQFLAICQKHGIRPGFVFFDDCHFPNPSLGEQPLPVKAYHNSAWLNCPARDLALRYAKGEATRREKKQLKGYVQKTMARFKDDERVLMWELYNEPGRGNDLEGDMAVTKVKRSIGDQSRQLVYDSWVWARAVNPSQPIMSCTAGSIGKTNIKINRINSDLHSIHSYEDIAGLTQKVNEYKKDGRPVIVTEWLARDRGSTVQDCLPAMKKLNVGAINWGFVAGESATIWNWNSRTNAEGKRRSVKQEREEGNVVKAGEPMPEPEIWFHDLFRLDGTPYDQNEIELFKELTGRTE